MSRGRELGCFLARFGMKDQFQHDERYLAQPGLRLIEYGCRLWQRRGGRLWGQSWKNFLVFVLRSPLKSSGPHRQKYFRKPRISAISSIVMKKFARSGRELCQLFYV